MYTNLVLTLGPTIHSICTTYTNTRSDPTIYVLPVCVVEEVEQMSGLFQQKQRELLAAVARVEELNQQLQSLRSRAEPSPQSPAHATQLDLLYKELQVACP